MSKPRIRNGASDLSNITSALSKLPAVQGVALDASSPQRVRGTGAIGAPNALAAYSEDYKAMERRVDELVAKEGQPVVLEIATLSYSDLHIGPIEEERVQRLVSNLANNKLNSPVVVRRTTSGKNEVVSGRHRIQAYLRLGRTTIECVLKEYTDEEVVSLVFFDNLLSPMTPDFYRYLGYLQMQEKLNLSLPQIATKAGVSKSSVYRLFSFGKLPSEAIETIKSNPYRFGANLAERLVNLVDDFPDLVVTAVNLIAAGKLEQEAAPDWVRDTTGLKPTAVARTPPLTTYFNRGNKKFAQVSVKGNKIVITARQTDDLEKLNNAVFEALSALSKITPSK